MVILRDLPDGRSKFKTCKASKVEALAFESASGNSPGSFLCSKRSSRSLSDNSIKSPMPLAWLTVRVPSWRLKNFSISKSFSSKPRRQRQRSLLSSRSPKSSSAMTVYTARSTIISLIFPMALVGFRFFGQTSTQFMMVWQRNRRYGSSRLSSRSPVASSLESAIKR